MVNVIIPGAPKSGTTSLSNYLDKSPEVSFLLGTELKFFHYNSIYKKGIQWYESFFPNKEQVPVVGEVSNIYLYSERAIQRIKAYNPNVKFIFCLRNPITRAYSQYNYCREKGTEILSFEKALHREKFRARIPFRFFRNNYAYQARGYYFNYLQKFFQHFDCSQFYFCIAEELQQNPTEELRKICKFLNISDEFVNHLDFSRRNVTRYPSFPLLNLPITLYKKFAPRFMQFSFLTKFFKFIEGLNYTQSRIEIKKETRSYLNQQFSEPNQELAALINKDLSRWK